jgi:cytochrome c
MRRRAWKAATVLAAVAIVAAASDPRQGRVLFERRCAGCHSLDKVKAAPPLRGVYGKAAASHRDFPYSDALKGARLTWDAATLDRWLADPDGLVPGNDMAFRVSGAAERADLIAYLKEATKE